MDLNIRGENYNDISGTIYLEFEVDGMVKKTRKIKFNLTQGAPTYHSFLGLDAFLSKVEVRVGKGVRKDKFIFNNYINRQRTQVCNVVLSKDYSFIYLDGFIITAKKQKSCGCLCL